VPACRLQHGDVSVTETHAFIFSPLFVLPLSVTVIMSDHEDDAKGEEEPTRKRYKSYTAIDVQKVRLEKLMKNIDKPIEIPKARGDRKFPEAPDFVRNVMGSSAGAGSGEFHVYRHLRRKEFARQRFIDEQARKETLDDKYMSKLETNKTSAEDKTSKKRAKRLKKKQKARQAAKKKKTGEDANKDSSSEDTEEEESSEAKETSQVTT
jgi:hypothetical protein